MKLLLILTLLLTSLYVRTHPVETEHGDDHDTDNHISEKSGEDDLPESDTTHEHTHDPEGDVDPLDEEMPEDFRLEEMNAEEECEEKNADGEDHKEEHVVEEKKEHKKPSLKDHAQGEHKIGKRSANFFDHNHGHTSSDKHREHPVRKKRSDNDESTEGGVLGRRRRSEESEEEKEGFEHHEFHDHTERKRRDTHEQHHVSSREEPNHPFKRSSGHRAPGGHENNLVKRNADDAVPAESEGLEEPTFASDDIEQVDSVAVRVKRVSRAGSSHKPRVMNKNRGNSRAGQAETGLEN